MEMIRVSDFNIVSNSADFIMDNPVKVGEKMSVCFDQYYYNVEVENVFKYKGLYKVKATIEADIISLTVANALRKEEEMTVSEWANRYRILDNSAAIPGKYSTDQTPYLIEIMDSLTPNNGIQEVWFMKSAQVGASDAANNYIGYVMDIANASTMIILPTKTDCEKYSKTRIEPLMHITARIWKKFEKHKPTDNKLVYKKLPKRGELTFGSAGNATDLRSIAAQNLLADEMDGYAHDLEGEGCPVDLALTRTETYGDRKKVFGYSTPTAEGFSKIEAKFYEGDQRHYNVECPHCNERFKFEFEGLKYQENRNNKMICIPESVGYECPHCKKIIEEKHKVKMVKQGIWIPTNLDSRKGVRSYHINSIYSFFTTWEKIINKWLAAQDDDNKKKAFFNVVLGLPYKHKAQRPSAKDAYDRRSLSFGKWECPDDVVYTVMSVDTQNDRFEFSVLGFGSNNRTYVIAHEIVNGDPQEANTQELLLKWFNKKILHLGTKLELEINEAVIDSGGLRTAAVYDFCRNNPKFTPIKGYSNHGKSFAMKKSEKINTDQNGDSFSNGLNLYLVNTVFMKEIIFQYMNNKDDTERNYIFFNRDLDQHYFDMICSEELIDYWSASKNMMLRKYVPIKKGMRNEALDCLVYAMALGRLRGCNLYEGDIYKTVYENFITNKLERLDVKKQPKKTVVNHPPSRFTRR